MEDGEGKSDDAEEERGASQISIRYRCDRRTGLRKHVRTKRSGATFCGRASTVASSQGTGTQGSTATITVRRGPQDAGGEHRAGKLEVTGVRAVPKSAEIV